MTYWPRFYRTRICPIMVSNEAPTDWLGGLRSRSRARWIVAGSRLSGHASDYPPKARRPEGAGASGKVYANDLQPEMLRMLRENAAQAQFTNVETVLGTETDPKLPKGQMDLVLLVDVYHEFLP